MFSSGRIKGMFVLFCILDPFMLVLSLLPSSPHPVEPLSPPQPPLSPHSELPAQWH